MISEKFACASSEVSDGWSERYWMRVLSHLHGAGFLPVLSNGYHHLTLCVCVCLFLCVSVKLQQVDLMGITIKSLAEIEKEVSLFVHHRDHLTPFSCSTGLCVYKCILVLNPALAIMQ